MADQHILIFLFIPPKFFLCFVQSSDRDLQKWNSTRWMEVGHNHSGLEWWLIDSKYPRLYAWQPNHGYQGPTYTKQPKSGPKFSRRSPEFGDPDSFPPGFNQTVARKVARKLESAFQTAFTTKLPASPNTANLIKTAEPYPKPGLASLIPFESRSLGSF